MENFLDKNKKSEIFYYLFSILRKITKIEEKVNL